MSSLHSFGSFVRCSKCGMHVQAVYADNPAEALAGLGVCPSCFTVKQEPTLLFVPGDVSREVELLRGELRAVDEGAPDDVDELDEDVERGEGSGIESGEV